VTAGFVAILAYVGLQLALGLAVSRRVTTESDYLVAGRSLGPFLVTFSMFATWFGAESCIGAAGAVYEHGLAGATADPFGYAGCLFLLGAVFAVPLWRRKLTTLADLFASRFDGRVERLAVVLMAPTSILWAAAQIRAFGQVVVTSSGVELETAIAFSAGVVIVYTAAGGLLADAVTDLLQGVVLAFGLIVLAVTIFATGVADLGSLAETGRALADPAPVPWWVRVESWAIPLCGSVLAQEMVARTVAARSPGLARGGAFAAGGMYLTIGMIPVGLGLLGARLVPGLEHGEQVLPRLALEHFPWWFYAVFAGALISAILSTVDSALLAAGSLVSHNLVVPLARDLDDRAKLRVARVCVVVFGVVAWALALYAEGVYALIENASAFASAGVLVAATFGLFTRVGGAKSALAALALGAGVWIFAAYATESEAPYLWSLAAALAGYLVVAAFERAPLEATAAPT
jgi:Na+/proline symporter